MQHCGVWPCLCHHEQPLPVLCTLQAKEEIRVLILQQINLAFFMVLCVAGAIKDSSVRRVQYFELQALLAISAITCSINTTEKFIIK